MEVGWSTVDPIREVDDAGVLAGSAGFSAAGVGVGISSGALDGAGNSVGGGVGVLVDLATAGEAPGSTVADGVRIARDGGVGLEGDPFVHPLELQRINVTPDKRTM